MTNREFRLWIRGYQELSGKTSFDARQIDIIQNHANLVKAVVGQLDPDIQNFIHLLEMTHVELETCMGNSNRANLNPPGKQEVNHGQ